MTYKVTREEAVNQINEYKKEYPEFVPFELSAADKEKLAGKYFSLIKTQNGLDTDDVIIPEKNNVTNNLSFLSDGSKVLLVGTGTGREVAVAKSMGLEAVGITLGTRNVVFGRRYLGLSKEELIESSIECMPFDSDMFDAVAGFQVFEHAISPLLFLLEIRRVMKIGASLILVWPPAKMYGYDHHPHHQICYSPGQARALFGMAGFGNVSLTQPSGELIQEGDMWNCALDYDMCIRGIKKSDNRSYIKEFEGIM